MWSLFYCSLSHWVIPLSRFLAIYSLPSFAKQVHFYKPFAERCWHAVNTFRPSCRGQGWTLDMWSASLYARIWSINEWQGLSMSHIRAGVLLYCKSLPLYSLQCTESRHSQQGKPEQKLNPEAGSGLSFVFFQDICQHWCFIMRFSSILNN